MASRKCQFSQCVHPKKATKPFYSAAGDFCHGCNVETTAWPFLGIISSRNGRKAELMLKLDSFLCVSYRRLEDNTKRGSFEAALWLFLREVRILESRVSADSGVKSPPSTFYGLENRLTSSCVSIKDGLFDGSWSERLCCSYKHALQFSPRCDLERLSNHLSESASQNERALRPMQLPSKLSGDFIWFDFLHFIPTPSKKGWKFSSAPSLTFKKKRKEDKHLYIDCHLTFTVLVIYMVIQGCMSHFSSHLSLSPHYKSAEAGTPPVYQDKAIWMDKAVSSTTKGLSLKEQARLLHQSHSSTHLHIFTSRLHN